MPTTLQITETALPALRRLQVNLENRAADAAIADAVVSLIQNHFHGLPPNKYGYPTTHFWRRAAESTTAEITDDGIAIRIEQIGIRQRLFGGPINPVRAQRLAIPANAQAYGHIPADFSHLKIARSTMSNGHIALALVPESTSAPAPTSSVLFWLVQSVMQKPDPTVLPRNDEFLTAIQSATASALK